MATKKKGTKYSPQASASVEREMKAMKEGKLRSGSGQKVTNPKQAIAIGLSEARSEGAKIPEPPTGTASAEKSTSKKTAAKKTPAKSSTKKAPTKKAAAKKAPAKKAPAKKSPAKKTSTKKSPAKKTGS